MEILKKEEKLMKDLEVTKGLYCRENVAESLDVLTTNSEERNIAKSLDILNSETGVESVACLVPVSIYARVTKYSVRHIRRLIKEGILKAERIRSPYGKHKYMYMVQVSGKELLMAFRYMEAEKEYRKGSTTGMTTRVIKLNLVDYMQYRLALNNIRCFYIKFNIFLEIANIDETIKNIPEEAHDECADKVYCRLTNENMLKIKEFARTHKMKIGEVIREHKKDRHP